jgi:hypothetical protein
MTERRKPAQKAQTQKAQTQRAAAPKKPTRRRRAPQAQSAAVPSGTARRPARQARQDPPIPADLVAHFGGQPMVDLIVHEQVPEDATAGDVLRLLLEGRRLGADLLRGDVFLKREGSRDGAGLGYAVVAKRDTLLRYADGLRDFLGHDEAPIFKDDLFRRGKPDADAGTLVERAGITHESGMPGSRGDLVGAWCVVEMRGKPPTVRVLDADQYLGTKQERAALDPDEVRARYPDACMVAAAMCNALRIATNLNDVVGADELSKRPEPLPQLGEPPAPPVFEEGPVDALDSRIMDAYRQAQALDPLLWTPAKVTAHLASAKTAAIEVAATLDEPLDGADPATYDRLRSELAAEIERDVQLEQARRRDPVANAKRLGELRAFDPSDLDEDARREYDTERSALEQDEREHAAPATA